MTAKRDVSRQRRSNQNRAARDALVARRQAASRGDADSEREPPVRRGRGRTRVKAAPVAPAKAKAATSSSPARSGRPSRSAPTPAAPAATADETSASGIWGRAQQLPGGRQMLGGFVLVVVASALAGFVPMFKEKGKKGTESFVQIVGPRALIFLAVPVAIAAIPLVFLNHPRRRVAWNIAAFLIGLWILLIPGLGIYYLFGAGAMVWGVLRASRAEGPAGLGFSRFRRPPRREAEPATEPLDANAKEIDTEA